MADTEDESTPPPTYENMQPADHDVNAQPQQNFKAPARRLTYAGGPGDEGYNRKLKVISQCFQYKAALFGTGKRSEFYKMVAEDCNKFYPELFNNMLKENSVRDLWNKAVKDSEAQQEDKEKRHHLWFNGSILREMTDWELLLDEIFTEKKAVESQKEAEVEKVAAEERDKRERLNAAFERTEQRYQSHSAQSASESPGAGSDENSPDKCSTEASYGRGTTKGNQHRARGNAGLTPDKQHDKLADACKQQADIAHTVQDILKEMKEEKRKTPEPPSQLEIEQVRIAKMTATAQLMETYLKFKQSGIEMPAMFRDMLQE